MFFWNGPWLVVAILAVWFLFGRRRRRVYLGQLERGISEQDAAALRQELDDQREYIASLETRVAELENRQDFTERLLTGPREVGKVETD